MSNHAEQRKKVDLKWEVKQLSTMGSSRELGATSHKVKGQRHIVVDRADLLATSRGRLQDELEIEFGVGAVASTERYDKGIDGFRWRFVFPASTKKPKRMPRWCLEYHVESDNKPHVFETRAPNREKAIELFRKEVVADKPVLTGVRRAKIFIRFETLVKRYGKPTWYETILPPKEAVIGKWGNTMFLCHSDCGGADYGRLGFALVNRYSVCTFPKEFSKEDRDVTAVTGVYFEEGDTP